MSIQNDSNRIIAKYRNCDLRLPLALAGWRRRLLLVLLPAAIVRADNPPSITSATTVYASVGTSVSYQISASNAPSSYAATNLPSGLSVNTGTGLITGTVAATGAYSTTVSATNANGTGNATVV